MTTEQQQRKGIISLSINDRAALYTAYMPFVENGGIFVPTSRSYDLGDHVFLLLRLMDATDPLIATATVVWITPTGAQGNKTEGIGIRFDEGDNGATRVAIEEHLAGMLESDRATHTM
ncbi:MAG TPA: pilus assembly protein PilZ [Gammaproteobacteria bacterium]|jgi:type IV pilus assembly protein PilZ|nr:pilus assembly protein PilZ [Gammaproteobacteria bacterium]